MNATNPNKKSFKPSRGEACSSGRESAPSSGDFRDESERTHVRCYGDMGFTIIELLVVMGTIALLAMTLLPALAATRVQSKVLACKARFRQWAASANLYANDNRGWLPSFNPVGGGEYAWDVGTNMLNALYPYGMNVPDWFCPMRPDEWNTANQWVQTQALLPAIRNINDLRLYFSRNYPGECQLNDNYWVPRTQGSTSFPIDFSSHRQAFWPPWIKAGNPTCLTYGWPQRLHDIAVPYVPFVSDTAGSGIGGGGLNSSIVGPNVTNIASSTAHFANGTLLGVNLAFADGHVASHSPSQMRAVYFSGTTYWFY